MDAQWWLFGLIVPAWFILRRVLRLVRRFAGRRTSVRFGSAGRREFQSNMFSPASARARRHAESKSRVRFR